ncbi:hypothetical protein TNCV_405151 [Trichonephila clavipes]|nr:hypothetical protein TNCV_405151 [Trichonephila clavipes]
MRGLVRSSQNQPSFKWDFRKEVPQLPQQPMRVKAYCAHLSKRDHWALRCPDQVISLKRNQQCLVPKKARYSFIDLLKG